VKQGQHIKRQQALGLCGNSGNSSEPHLHFHIQNIENSSEAIGTKCYFDKLLVNGQPQSDYSPVKDDLIKNQ
jgi:murein DD-endopeptidase MepM/ murein hydrolase activator NlpD